VVANRLGAGDELRRRMLRVPALSWGSAKDAEAGMLESFAAEGLQGWELDVAASALLLGRGSVEALAAVAGMDAPGAAGTLLRLSGRYPFFALDEDAESFITPEFSPKGIVKALRSRLDDAASAPGSGMIALQERAATELLAQGAGERAAEVAACMSRATSRIVWLAFHQSELMESLFFIPASRVYASIGTALTRNPLANRLRLGQALRLGVLGRGKEALAEVCMVQNSTAASPGMQLAAAIIGMQFGPAGYHREALEALREALAAMPEDAASGLTGLAKLLLSSAETPETGLESRLEGLVVRMRDSDGAAANRAVEGLTALRAGMAGAASTGDFPAAEDTHVSELALLAGALLVAREASAQAPAEGEDGNPESLLSAGQTREFRRNLLALRDRLCARLAAWGDGAYTSDGCLTCSASIAVAALASLAEAGLPCPDLPSAKMAAFRRTEARLEAQRNELAETYTDRPVRAGGAVLPYKPLWEASEEPASASRSHTRIPESGTAIIPEPLRPFAGQIAGEDTPVLYVRLLGCCEVWAGDRPVETRELSRQKVRTLLAILTLHAGQELTREQLTGELWPNAYTDVAARSFYSVWSKLKRILCTRPGECPYLTRLQNGYRLESRLVKSDAARVMELARIFLLGRVDATRWLELLDEFEDLYRGELLPGETGSVMIQAFRVQFRRKAIDALIAASARLLAEGENDAALLFAYAAFQRERQREDVYLALMRAQLACNQRTGAVDTYFACREMLAEGLGLDPSRKMMDLYLSVLNDEEPPMPRAM
ncbi:MAG: hypothetical protein IKF96_02635, partial [Eggerthellaceae bacterium]|nr:hypothetical protein [Eggerthellaceae bacterium]